MLVILFLESKEKNQMQRLHKCHICWFSGTYTSGWDWKAQVKDQSIWFCKFLQECPGHRLWKPGKTPWAEPCTKEPLGLEGCSSYSAIANSKTQLPGASVSPSWRLTKLLYSVTQKKDDLWNDPTQSIYLDHHKWHQLKFIFNIYYSNLQNLWSQTDKENRVA